MTRESLSYEADMRELNRRNHPHHREGMRGAEIGGGLRELRPSENPGLEDPQDREKVRANPDLPGARRDSVSGVDQKSHGTSVLTRSRTLVTNLLFCLSREGRRSRLLQRRLRSLHHAILESKLHCDSWPVDVAPLIRSHQLRDPWKPGEPLQVKYTAPTEGRDGLSREHVLAEYVREGRRKFALYADGHQETWRLKSRIAPTTG